MHYLTDRFRDPSTWAGVAALFTSLGLSDVLADSVAAIVIGIGGIIAILVKARSDQHH